MEYLRSYLHDTGFVPSVVLLFVFYALLRGLRDSMWRIAVLSLPGTIAHVDALHRGSAPAGEAARLFGLAESGRR
jgi:hypothetical protein